MMQFNPGSIIFEMESAATIENFLGSWEEGAYGDAYDLLSKESPLKAGLSRDAWVEKRRTWARTAQPARLKVEIAPMLEDANDKEDEAAVQEDLNVFWSLVLNDTTRENAPPELPVATISYKETGRQWFWTRYNLIEEDGELLIESMIDEGAKVQSLSAEELQQHIQELAEAIQAITENAEEEVDEDNEEEGTEEVVVVEEDDEDEDEDEEDAAFLTGIEEQLQDLIWSTTEAMHYSDALIAQLPADYEVHDRACAQAIAVQAWERAAAYLELIAERFPEHRGEALRKLALTLITIEDDTDEEDEEDEARAYRFTALAEQALRDSITVDNAPAGYILLAEILIAQDKQLDEAESLLQKARAIVTEPQDAALVEAGLGKIADSRENYQDALAYYQRAANLSPDLPSIWLNIGMMQNKLDRQDEAVESYLRSIETEPDETAAYTELSALYMLQGDTDLSREILTQGLEYNPDAADILACTALYYVETRDLRQAKEFLDRAEDADPELELVHMVREVYEQQRAQQKAKHKHPQQKSQKSHKHNRSRNHKK